MTPLKIEMMLHYYTSATDYRDGDFSAPAVREAINWFRDEAGMLAANDPKAGKDTAYSITEKGKFYVEYICSVPLPVTRHAIEQGV